MKKFLSAAAVAALMFTVAACGGSSDEPVAAGSASASGEKLKVALINGVLTGTQSQCAFSGVKQVLAAGGHTWADSSSAYNVENELRNVQSAISQGVDMIMLWSAFPQSAQSEVRAAKAAGIPIYLFWNNPGDDVSADDLLGSAYYDFKGSGVATGKWIADNVPNAKVMELTGALGSGTAEDIMAGTKEGMGTSGEIVVSQDAAWDAAKAASLAQSLLPSHPEVNVIVTHNDDMALAVIRVVKQLNLQDKVKVVTESVSGDAGIAAVKSGEIPFAALDPLAQYGIDAMTAALALKGGSGEKAIQIGPSHYDTSKNDLAFCNQEYMK
ncbi:sugar ABC transporter substrate-binding protein [Actinoplanes sp. LDG1-06]|uniref:Sugar ABC transporter substrate-binding protein n=1 Tax=Paractinoplanes ovalisporus TaxID=2810368 RepID=A0ABS2A771_9ACTN|nr:sugar ABC transporter substrate-binding protein [Actinoplanes ovalisporus]MBM2615688.1 sugar ABC transporter substrate-binding protein [Actinoplanes ovalisporus]